VICLAHVAARGVRPNALDLQLERVMADQNRDKKSEDSAADERLREDLAPNRRDENGEWLRDQTGEDHNLSGSSTYRTLPDQPESDKSSDDDDSSDRQSNR
jgi:hypothetical protein